MNNLLHITNEDCMHLMARYPDKYFDLAVCDIPYGIGAGKMAFTQEVSNTVKQKNGKSLNFKRRSKYKLNDWDKTPPPQEYFDELTRVSHDQIIFGVEYVNWAGLQAGRIKWDKCIPEGVSFKKYEMAYCSLIEKTTDIKLLWAGMQQAKSLSEPMTSQGNKKLNEKRIHPCHKPVLLYKWLLSQYAHSGAKILDTHLGGASIAIACNDLGYDLTACELDKDYYEAALKRIELNTRQKSLF